MMGASFSAGALCGADAAGRDGPNGTTFCLCGRRHHACILSRSRRCSAIFANISLSPSFSLPECNNKPSPPSARGLFTITFTTPLPALPSQLPALRTAPPIACPALPAADAACAPRVANQPPTPRAALPIARPALPTALAACAPRAANQPPTLAAAPRSQPPMRPIAPPAPPPPPRPSTAIAPCANAAALAAAANAFNASVATGNCAVSCASLVSPSATVAKNCELCRLNSFSACAFSCFAASPNAIN